MWVNTDCVIQSELSQKERKPTLYISICIWNLEKWYRGAYLQERNRDADIENGPVDPVWEGEGRTNRGSSADMYTTKCNEPAGAAAARRGLSSRSMATRAWGKEWQGGLRGRGQTDQSLSSVAQSFATLCDPTDCSTSGFPVHHQLPELAQTHVHRVGDAIQPSHPLSSPSPTFNLSQHQGLFQRVSSLQQVAKVLEFQLQHQYFQ